MNVKQFMTDGIEAITAHDTVLNASRMMKKIILVPFLSSMMLHRSSVLLQIVILSSGRSLISSL